MVRYGDRTGLLGAAPAPAVACAGPCRGLPARSIPAAPVAAPAIVAPSRRWGRGLAQSVSASCALPRLSWYLSSSAARALVQTEQPGSWGEWFGWFGFCIHGMHGMHYLLGCTVLHWHRRFAL